VLLTNAGENYYAAYSGTTPEIATAINNGFGDEGVAEIRRGTPPDLGDPASAFVFCIQNHDQVGNRPFGDRLHHQISADRYAVASALLLFAPETPLLFMGQEFAASTPFLYFTDHPEELGRLVTEGRREEFSGFRLFDDAALRQTIPDPQAESTFLGSKLNWQEARTRQDVLEMYRMLIGWRRRDPVLRHNDRQMTQAFWLTAQAVGVHRWLGGQHRLLIANFGNASRIDLRGHGIPAGQWEFMMSTGATVSPRGLGEVTIPARTAVMFGIR
jgi:maltooligosyltrehalose trehalohydrolase